MTVKNMTYRVDIDGGHDDFTYFMNYPACSVVQTLNFSERCNYVRNTPECQSREFYVNYINLFYCFFDPRSDVVQVFGLLCLLSCCTVMFLILGTTADRFFCPALKVMSKVMGMNEHLAGVTMLAFGNGSPDLFTSLAGVHDHSRLLFNDLFGAGIYVIALVGGMIIVLYPFKLQSANVLRDVCFFLLGVIYIDYAIESDGVVTILESILILSIYFSYLIVICVDQYLLKQYVSILDREVKRRNTTPDVLEELAELRTEASIDLLTRDSRLSIDVEMTRTAKLNVLAGPNEQLFQQLFVDLNPINVTDWKRGSCMAKTLIILRTPINLMLLLHIPIVDYELDGHGWSKLLNIIQIVLLPLVISIAMVRGQLYYGHPVYLYTMFITVPIAVYVFLTSRTDIPPKYHTFFAVYSILGSVFTIYSCANETVQILFLMGIVTFSSNSFLGCTLLAWGNGIGDFVSNLALARYGYQKMGYAACYGGPFFNSLLAMGATFLYRALASDDGITVVNKGPLGENVMIFMMLLLFTTLIWTVLTDYHARRCCGIFNLLLYLLFFLYALLSEAEVIKSFAADDLMIM